MHHMRLFVAGHGTLRASSIATAASACCRPRKDNLAAPAYIATGSSAARATISDTSSWQRSSLVALSRRLAVFTVSPMTVSDRAGGEAHLADDHRAEMDADPDAEGSFQLVHMCWALN